MKQIFRIVHAEARINAVNAVKSAPQGFIVEIKELTRNLEQNAALWAALMDISRQVIWYGERLTENEWKDVFTASLKKQRVVPGIDGGFVVCGQKTSRMSKAEFSELLDLIYAFGAEHNVRFNNGMER